MARGPARMVIGSVLEADAGRAIVALRAAPADCEWVELRADSLRADEVERVVREVERPTLVSARRRADGGAFDGAEEERRVLLERALAAGAAAIDVEWDAPFASLARRAEHAGRVVVSHHGGPCRVDALRKMLDRLVQGGTGLAKLVPRAASIGDALAIREILAEARREGIRLAAFASGAEGVPSRILAPSWGSFATYGSLVAGQATGPGQLPVDDLLDTYRVREIRDTTRLFALLGSHVATSPSPAMHRAGYREAGIDACFLPLETDDPLAAISLAGELGVSGLAVTRPFKERLAARASPGDDVAVRAQAVNTVLLGPVEVGFNTDGPAAVERVARHLAPAGARVAIIGSGGTARGFAAAFVAAQAVVTIYGRSLERARSAARATGAGAEDIERLGAGAWDVLLHATPRGADGDRFLEPECLTGRVVLDAVYAPRTTPLVEDARARGLAVVDGVELLAAQAVLQFRHMTGKGARFETLHRAAARWLGRLDGGTSPE